MRGLGGVLTWRREVGDSVRFRAEVADELGA